MRLLGRLWCRWRGRQAFTPRTAVVDIEKPTVSEVEAMSQPERVALGEAQARLLGIHPMSFLPGEMCIRRDGEMDERGCTTDDELWFVITNPAYYILANA